MHLAAIIRHLPLLVRLLPLAVAVVTFLAFAPSAHAAFPGDNGKLAAVAYSPPGCSTACESEVFTVNPDGTGLTNVTNRTGGEADPSWSPDGTKIAFAAGYGGQSDIYRVNSDGTGMTAVTNDPENQFMPAWSPDGNKIAFASTRDGNYEVYVMNADGSDQTRLTNDAAFDANPAWSPDGTRIAFVHGNDIHFMNPDGSGRTMLPFDPICRIGQFEAHPDWAPAGDRIAFIWGFDTDCTFELEPEASVMTVRLDGTDEKRLQTGSANEPFDPVFSPDGSWVAFHADGSLWIRRSDGTPGPFQLVGSGMQQPDWQPLYRGYVRPKGASPMRVPLVPAFKRCTSPNSTHGGPLSHGSCSPPAPQAARAFIGIGDGNPAPAKSIGSVVLRAIAGTAGTTDDADLAIVVSITNVMSTSDRSDYTGELRLELPLRITDRFNRPSPSQYGPGTVTDTSFFATVPCAATADTTLGAACTVSTSVDALLPGTIREGARSIWALGDVRLHDGGADGDAETPADNELFAVQGVFVP